MTEEEEKLFKDKNDEEKLSIYEENIEKLTTNASRKQLLDGVANNYEQFFKNYYEMEELCDLIGRGDRYSKKDLAKILSTVSAANRLVRVNEVLRKDKKRLKEIKKDVMTNESYLIEQTVELKNNFVYKVLSKIGLLPDLETVYNREERLEKEKEFYEEINKNG